MRRLFILITLILSIISTHALAQPANEITLNTPPIWLYSLKDLSEVTYDDIPTSSENERKANRYSPNKPYDQQRLQNHFNALEQEYGTEKLQRAKDLLAIVHENSDANAAEALIKLEDKYGLEIIQQAQEAIEDKKSDNPKKSISYLIGTIKKMGEATTSPESKGK